MSLEIAFSALVGLLTSPYIVRLMVVGVLVGIFMGVAPGVGGKLGLVLLIPFVYGMDPLAGAVFLLVDARRRPHRGRGDEHRARCPRRRRDRRDRHRRLCR